MSWYLAHVKPVLIRWVVDLVINPGPRANFQGLSLVVELHLYTVMVTGSSPVVPTNFT